MMPQCSRNWCAILALLPITFTAPRLSHAQGRGAVRACTEHRPALKNALLDVHKRQRNIGLSATVVLGGRTILAEQIGFADLEHQVPVTAATRFGVASITKAFTGLALLKLREAGRIDLDAPIQRYVPAFPVKPGTPITPRLLAAHLAGIRHWAVERNADLYSRHFDDVNDILPLFSGDTLLSAPGSAVRYSSYGYNLIGAAIQSASGVRYQDYVQRTVIAPLGLTSTGYDDVRRVLRNRARRYSYFHPWTFAVDSANVYRVPDWDYSHNMAGGNMYSTAGDLARLGSALLKPGLLSRESFDLLYTRTKFAKGTADMSYGLFVSDSSAAHRRLSIGGSNAGLQAGLVIYPDDDLVIVVLANTWGIGSSSGEMTQGLTSRLASICMGWKPE